MNLSIIFASGVFIGIVFVIILFILDKYYKKVMAKTEETIKNNIINYLEGKNESRTIKGSKISSAENRRKI